MEAGREMDCILDEKAMGHPEAAASHRNVCAGKKSDKPGYCEGPDHDYLKKETTYHRCGVPPFSTVLEEAWKLIEEIPGTGMVQKDHDGNYVSILHTATNPDHCGMISRGEAKTPALAICRAVGKWFGI